MPTPTTPPPPLEPPRAVPLDAARRLRSDVLFGGADEVVIEHRGAVYRLRRTAQGKLILTK